MNEQKVFGKKGLADILVKSLVNLFDIDSNFFFYGKLVDQLKDSDNRVEYITLANEYAILLWVKLTSMLCLHFLSKDNIAEYIPISDTMLVHLKSIQELIKEQPVIENATEISGVGNLALEIVKSLEKYNKLPKTKDLDTMQISLISESYSCYMVAATQLLAILNRPPICSTQLIVAKFNEVSEYLGNETVRLDAMKSVSTVYEKEITSCLNN